MLIVFADVLAPAGLVGGVMGGLVSWGLRVWWENRVKHASTLALAKFQAELSGAAAAASFDYQRRLQDFNLFVTKKHEVIARLHELLLDAMSKIAHFAQGGQKLRALLTDMHVDDVADYLEHDAGVPRGKRAEILARWDSDRTEALANLHQYQDTMEGEHARRAWVIANNYRLAHDLYLPPELARHTDEFMKRLARLQQLADSEQGEPTASTHHEASAIHQDLDVLRSVMRAEMARGELASTRAQVVH